MTNLLTLRKILIAVENSPYSDKAVSFGFQLAKTLNAEVALVHVNEIQITTPYSADPLLNESPTMVPEMMNLQENASQKLFDRIQDAWGEDTVIYTFSKIGRPKDEILATADEWDAEMIILGTHGRTGFDHFISGSIAESVARRAKCPVLIIPNKEEPNQQKPKF